MTTILVWMLVFRYDVASRQASDTIVIDNLPTLEECQRVQQVLKSDSGYTARSRCIQVTKVKM